jgi:hypothetical protein
MRYVLPLMLLLSLAFVGSGYAEEEIKAGDALAKIRLIDLKLSKDNEELKTEKELLTFDQGKDEVIWIRTYPEDEKITQVYEIVKDRMAVKDGVVIIPLKWVSMANPSEKNYNPDKHDVGIRAAKKDGHWIVTFYAIDSKGVEVDIKFEEPAKE